MQMSVVVAVLGRARGRRGPGPRPRRRRGRRWKSSSLRSAAEKSAARSRRGPCRPGGRPMPNAHPQVVLGAQRAGDRAQAVVAALAAAALEPQRAERDVELVVHHDECSAGIWWKSQQPAHRAAGLVHVRAGLGEHDPRRRAGRAGPRRRPGRAPCAWRTGRRPARRARRATMAPTLCRLPAYAGPGLPSPTTRPTGWPRGASCRRRGRGSAGLSRRDSAGLAAAWSRSGTRRPRRHPRRPRRLLALDAGLGLGLGQLGLELLGGRRGEEAMTTGVGVGDQRRCPRAATTSPAVMFSPTVQARRWRPRSGPGCGSRRPRPVSVFSCWSTRPSRGGLAGRRDRDLDGDLLAAADEQQVDVLVGAA